MGGAAGAMRRWALGDFRKSDETAGGIQIAALFSRRWCACGDGCFCIVWYGPSDVAG